MLFSGVNAFFYPRCFSSGGGIFSTSTLQCISPTCGKLIRYATLLRLLVLFHFVFPAIQYFVNMTHFTHFQSKWKRGREGRGIEYAIVRSFGGNAYILFLSLFYSSFVVISLNKNRFTFHKISCF